MTMTEPLPHSRVWYEHLAERQGGYYYPWSSTIDEGGGEGAYDALVGQHLSETVDLVDVGCGHGEDVLRFAKRVRTAVGLDRVARFLERAEARRLELSIPNVRFLLADSSTAANEGRARLPFDNASIDLFLCRRGPTSWLADARRVGRPGAIVIQLEAVASPSSPWDQQIPMELRPAAASELIEERIQSVRDRVDLAGLVLESVAGHDVAERLKGPVDLFRLLTFGRDPNAAPKFEEVAEGLTAIFACCADERGLAIRNRRILWKARV
jgi:SAM-dependent methyltransferase